MKINSKVNVDFVEDQINKFINVYVCVSPKKKKNKEKQGLFLSSFLSFFLLLL